MPLKKALSDLDLVLTLTCAVGNFVSTINMTRGHCFLFSRPCFVPRMSCVGEALQHCCVCSASPGSREPWLCF